MGIFMSQTLLRASRFLPLATFLALGACGIDAPTGPMAGSALSARKPPRPNPTHDPILFVHGWNASSSTWTTMVGRFKNDQWTANELVNWSYNYRQSNTVTAAQIAAKIDSILAATGATKVDIITHSMGALSARYYIRNLGGDGKVDALITLGGANHGTNTALFCADTSCIEMRPNSSFLTTLNSVDESWGSPRYATWWSSCDAVISPQSSALLLGATNNAAGCIDHSQLHESATVYSQVKAWVQ